MRTKIEFIILLLQVIKFNGNANYLVFQGYSFSQIFNTIDKLVSKGYVTDNNDILFLTQKGNEYLIILNKKLGRKGLYRYVSPQLNFKSKKKMITEIYLPLKGIKE